MTQPSWWDNWGWLVSIGILVSILWVNFIAPCIRAFRMKKPYSAYFKSDDTNDKPTSTQIKVGSPVEIQIRTVAKLRYAESGLIFGFKGDPNKKPLPKSVINRFIAEGLRQSETPLTTDKQFIDYKGNYHIEYSPPKVRTRGTTYAIGFLVQPQAPGTYEVFMTIFTDESEGKLSNKLYVEVVA